MITGRVQMKPVSAHVYKKKLILFFSCALPVFFIYLTTISENLSYQSDYIQIPLEIEGLTSEFMRPAFHILWYPLGKLAYNLSLAFRFGSSSIVPLELLNIVLASIGAGLFFLLMNELTDNIIVAACLTASVSFSYPLWQEFTHTKLYSGGFLFSILTFYLYRQENMKCKPLIFGIVNGMAFLFHVSHVVIVGCTISYFLFQRGSLKERLLNGARYFLVLALFVTAAYFLIYKTTPVPLELKTFIPSLVSYYQSTWVNYLTFNTLIYLGLNPEQPGLHRNWPLLINLFLYLALFVYVFLTSTLRRFRDSFVHICFIYIITFLAAATMTSQRNPNIFTILIPFNCIFALAINTTAQFSSRSRVSICALLAAVTVSMGCHNFIDLYKAKSLSSDFIYVNVIEQPCHVISSKDVIIANSSVPYYFEYYRKCRVYNADVFLITRHFDELVNYVKKDIEQGKRVRVVLDTVADYNLTLIKPIDTIDTSSLLHDLSKDFFLELLHNGEEGRFLVYSLEKPVYVSLKGTICVDDGTKPSFLKSLEGHPGISIVNGLRITIELDGKKRDFDVFVNDRRELAMSIPVRNGPGYKKIDRITFSKDGCASHTLLDVPVNDFQVNLGTIMMK
jgi:hypothetical protein